MLGLKCQSKIFLGILRVEYALSVLPYYVCRT
jgi:hypothetical protein